MAGPVAAVPFREPLAAREVEALDAWIRSVSSGREGTIGAEGTIGGWGDFWIGDPAILGLPPFEDEPCAFSIGLEGPELTEEMSLAAMAACLGYRPAQFVVVVAGCRGAQNHRILGELTLRIAERYSGMIELGGALSPYIRLWELPPDATQDDHPSRSPEAIRAFVAALPGRVCEIPYPASRGRTLFSHLVDAEFMRAWLRHPEFHMIT